MTDIPKSRVAFDGFVLDPADRQLSRGGTPVEINARYLDALALLVGERGKLVTKDRFLQQVWRGIPVTDEALTQCIRTLRRQLGDDAAAPRFIETVPKHGYRFIAAVRAADDESAASAIREAPADPRWRQVRTLGVAGTLGGGLAGAMGGLFYGFAGASQTAQPGMGAASVLIVLVCVTVVVALIGAAGVAFGICAATLATKRQWQWSVAGGAFGGLVVGAVVNLLGIDAFNLLLGSAPAGITGAPEGAVLGAAVGFGAGLARSGRVSVRRGVAFAALAGGVTGVAIPLLGGRLMGGSLALLADSFPGSRLSLDRIGSWFGEDGFGPTSQAVTGGLEGLLFAGCIVGAMLFAEQADRTRA
ncbi:transcriptional regulator [Altererythrobacter soli]|uniref:Transcriptional regulator n=1 Tax=Croceibacterium soli TaxID=1739690 RepID=A0A6I4URQ1_9SPHN|nr:transcriptional regulator [Croceibacterium soli]MXP40217.1 transcriptional regulator [Croceibacterium soli]